MVVEFPCCYPQGSKLAKDMTAIDQLEVVKELQTVWSDNSVSCTIYYRLHEIDEIKKWLGNNFRYNVKTCSFLLHNDHGFVQAPFEEITKEKYEELLNKVTPITSGKILYEEVPDMSGECASGVCQLDNFFSFYKNKINYSFRVMSKINDDRIKLSVKSSNYHIMQ